MLKNFREFSRDQDWSRRSNPQFQASSKVETVMTFVRLLALCRGAGRSKDPGARLTPHASASYKLQKIKKKRLGLHPFQKI